SSEIARNADIGLFTVPSSIKLWKSANHANPVDAKTHEADQQSYMTRFQLWPISISDSVDLRDGGFKMQI
ncbi:MAG: hypothetical protein ACOC8I_04630, partial [Desulfosalsimonas sp.]